MINKFCPLHPRAGGAEKNLEETFSRIGERTEVHLIAAMFPGAKREERHRNITITRLGSARSENIIRIHLLVPFLLRAHLRRLRPDVLVEDMSVVPFFSPWLCPAQKKVVLIHHLNGLQFFRSQRFPYALIGYLAEKLFLLSYRRETVVTVSGWMRNTLAAHGFTNLHVIKNGVDHKLIGMVKERSPVPMVLFLGRLENRKGPDLFLKTYSLVKRKVPNVRYVLAGQSFERFNVPGGVERLGAVTEERKRELLRTAWLCVAPSRIEGYGIVPLEAAATGTFVVGNDVEGLRESVRDGVTGTLIDCRDAERFAATIVSWLDEKKLRARESDCRAWAQAHNWDTSASATATLIESR